MAARTGRCARSSISETMVSGRPARSSWSCGSTGRRSSPGRWADATHATSEVACVASAHRPGLLLRPVDPQLHELRAGLPETIVSLIELRAQRPVRAAIPRRNLTLGCDQLH